MAVKGEQEEMEDEGCVVLSGRNGEIEEVIKKDWRPQEQWCTSDNSTYPQLKKMYYQSNVQNQYYVV